MKITIESTTKVVTILGSDGEVQARVWEGETDSGIKVECLIPRIAAHAGQDLSQFERELEQCKAPTADVQLWPLRMIL